MAHSPRLPSYPLRPVAAPPERVPSLLGSQGLLGSPPTGLGPHGCLLSPQTMLTAISMSAIATNGVVPGG